MNENAAIQLPLVSQKILQIKGLVVSFDGFKAINQLDFSLDYGELRFLIGPNGAGKTTLLDAICGKVKPTKGHILFKDHIDLSKHQEHQIAQLGVGRKFQTPSIFTNLTLFENLLLSMRQQRGILSALLAKTTGEQKDQLLHCLKLIGLAGKAKESAASLSHGEKQWLEIGMLLMQEPDLLLLDEPAAGMTDSETEKTGELLHQISKNQTIIVVEHDMEFVRRFAKTITVMHEGKLLSEGTMKDIQANDKVAEVYLGRRAK
jgi:urea transport system ATP-binding protein